MQQAVQQQRCSAGKGVCTVVLFSVAELAKRQNCISCAVMCQYQNQIIILSGFQGPERRVAVNGRNGRDQVFNC